MTKGLKNEDDLKKESDLVDKIINDFNVVVNEAVTKLNAKKISIENKLLNKIIELLKEAARNMFGHAQHMKTYSVLRQILFQINKQKLQILNKFYRELDENESLDKTVKYNIHKILLN